MRGPANPCSLENVPPSYVRIDPFKTPDDEGISTETDSPGATVISRHRDKVWLARSSSTCILPARDRRKTASRADSLSIVAGISLKVGAPATAIIATQLVALPRGTDSEMVACHPSA